MYRFFLKKFAVIAVLIFLVGIQGCGGPSETVIAPSDSMSKTVLTGPYDKEIPQNFINQLKEASLTNDWAVPYIFVVVGMHYESLGDPIRSIHFFERAIHEFRQRKDQTGEGTALNRKIFALYSFGKIEDAYKVIQDLEKEWTSGRLRAFVYHNYAHYYLMNGDYGKSLGFFRKAFQANNNFHSDFNLLMLRRDSELEYGIAIMMADYFPAMSREVNLLDFDETFYKAIRKNVNEGIRHLQQVIILNHQIRKTKIGKYIPENIFQVMEARTYNFLGLSYGIKGQADDGIKILETSLKLAKAANYRIGEIDNIFFCHQIYLLGKNITEGRKAARELEDVADRYHLPFYQIWTKFILSRYDLGFGDHSQAISHLKNALAIMEAQRSEPVIDALKEPCMFHQQTLYEALIELLAGEGDDKGAFETAERAKARAIINLVANKNIGKTPAEQKLLRQDKKYVHDMADGYRKFFSVFGGGEPALKSALDSIEEARLGHRNVITKIREQNEELCSLISVIPSDAEEIRRLLDGNTTLFSYYVSDKVLYIWAVNKDRVRLERIRINKEEVARLVSSFYSAITSKDKKQTAVWSEKVYDVFLKPVIPFVKGDRIGFIPHGPLYYLPFSAMSYKGQYLVDVFSLFQLPDAGMLKYVLEKKSSQGQKILAFGNPDLGNRQLDLPYAETEVENIRDVFPGTSLYLRGEATKGKVKELLQGYDIVHFAVHGSFIEKAPMNSGLLLATDRQGSGLLTAAEIFSLNFQGRLVIMSACETAPGPSANGTEIMGLSRAFLYAGTPSVIATLWNIEDKSTAVFMKILYRNIKKNNDIADSLRNVQTEMIRLGYDPYHWAAFTLTGRY